MDKTQVIKTETEELLKKMIDEFEIDVSQEEEVFQIIIKTDKDAPSVIGRHGETIRAIQKIIEVILYKKFSEPTNILVNVNDFREKQTERLKALTSDMADRVMSTKEEAYLKGLSSYERKIIHEYVTSNYSDLTTYSTGDGRDRKLVISLKKDEEQQTPEESEEKQV